MSKTLIRLTSSADDVVIDSPERDYDENVAALANMAEASKNANMTVHHKTDMLVLVAPEAELTFAIVAA